VVKMRIQDESPSAQGSDSGLGSPALDGNPNQHSNGLTTVEQRSSARPRPSRRRIVQRMWPRLNTSKISLHFNVDYTTVLL